MSRFKTGEMVGPDDDKMIALGHKGKVMHDSGYRTIWTCKICGYSDDVTADLRKVG